MLCAVPSGASASQRACALLAGKLAAQDLDDLYRVGLAFGGAHVLADQGVEGLALARAFTQGCFD